MPAPKRSHKAIGDDDPLSSSDEVSHTNRGYAEIEGFLDTGIPASLYGLWRHDVVQLMRETAICGPQRAGTDRWSTLHWHAAGLPTMAPRGRINYYSDEAIVHWVNMLCQDSAMKVRSGENTRGQAIKATKSAHVARYPNDPPPDLADVPEDLGSLKKQPLMTISGAHAGMRIQKGGSQANAELLAWQVQRLGGLWAPAMAYRPVSARPQGGDAC